MRRYTKRAAAGGENTSGLEPRGRRVAVRRLGAPLRAVEAERADRGEQEPERREPEPDGPDDESRPRPERLSERAGHERPDARRAEVHPPEARVHAPLHR